jgi:small subunit ribosomal protein S6
MLSVPIKIGTDLDQGEVYTTKRNYESLLIVPPTLTEEQVEEMVAKFRKLVEDHGGEVTAAGKWDKRRLAYDVKGYREGNFILMFFAGEPSVSKELDRVFRISDDCIRHLITLVEMDHVDVTRVDAQYTVQAEERPQPVAAVEELAVEAEAPEEAAVEPQPEEAVAEPEAVEEAPAEAEAEAPAPAEEPVEEAPEEVPAEAAAEEAAAEPEEAAAAVEPEAEESEQETEESPSKSEG